MTFSLFAKILKNFYNKKATNGTFVLNLFDESLEDVSEEDEELVLETNGCLSYNPIRSEDTARKYYDGSRKISRQNFSTIEKHFERNKFFEFLENNILNTDDNFRHLCLKLKSFGIESNENNIKEKCADIFDEIIATADKDYRKPSELNIVNDEEQEEFKVFVYNILKKLVVTEYWPFRSKQFRIFKDEIYELVQEDCDERFDISIENYNGENTTPAIKLIIKCKKANTPISKDDLVLFWNKVNQISGSCKTLFITNSSIEQNALWYAQIMGIGIIRIFDSDKINWLAPRKMNEPIIYSDVEKAGQEIQKAILEPDYEILNNFAVGYFENFYGNISSVFNKIFTNNNDYPYINNMELFSNENDKIKTNFLSFFSDQKLKTIAESVRLEIYGEDCKNILKIEMKDLIFFLKKKYNFYIEFPLEEPRYTFPEKIRGLVDYKKRIIFIYGIKDADLHLLKFSIAHEISHLILHMPLLEKDNFFYFSEETKESQRLEAQANKLANYIILNDVAFQEKFKLLAKKYYLNANRGYYLYLDNQPCNITQFMQITDELIENFDVSREQIKYRLLELGWLKLPEPRSFEIFNRIIV